MLLVLLLFSSTCYEDPPYIFLHFLQLRPHLLSLCYYILYLLLYTSFFLFSLSFLHSVFVFYTFSLFIILPCLLQFLR